MRVLLVRDEEQSCGQSSCAGVDSVGVVVTATQDLRATVVVGVCESHVREPVDCVLAGVESFVEVDRGELTATRQGSAVVLGAAEDQLLVADVVGVPRLDVHADFARHQIRAALHPRLIRLVADPHPLFGDARVLGLDVRRSVLEPEQVPRCHLRSRRGRCATETLLEPAQRDNGAADTGKVADGVKGDLRVFGARLHADVAAADRRVDRRVNCQLPQRFQGRGHFVAQAESIVEQSWAEAHCDREFVRPEVEGFAGVRGR